MRSAAFTQDSCLLLLLSGNLNDMVAKLCGDRVGYRAHTMPANGIFKRLHHFPLSKPTKITPTRLARTGGVAPSHLLKTGTLLDLLLQAPR